MQAARFVIVALMLLSINASLVADNNAHKADLTSPKPCRSDHGSQSENGQGSCINGDLRVNIRTVGYEQAIEKIASSCPITSYTALAEHVVAVSYRALGHPAVVTDQSLASLAWIFRLRHTPEPVIVAAGSTRGDAARLVRYVLTNETAQAEHKWCECEIKEFIAAVNVSTQMPTGFVFRIVRGYDNEYDLMSTQRIAQRIHIFAAVHNEQELKVSVYSAEVSGEFIKGHGGQGAVSERQEVSIFLKTWLLNQWVNMWSCNNPKVNMQSYSRT